MRARQGSGELDFFKRGRGILFRASAHLPAFWRGGCGDGF